MDASAVDVTYFVPPRAEQAAPPPADAATGPAQPAAATDDSDGLSFHAVLSALNPLQYLPVVGTIYRAVTGDTIPDGLRMAGSFLFSALTGGPIGMAINAATTVAEKLTGFDPEAIARDVADVIGLGASHPGAPDEATPRREAGAPPRAVPDASALALNGPEPVSDARRMAGLASYGRFAIA